MHIAIRADGGQSIGYGHLMRTSALANQLLDRGVRVTYATTTPENVRDICPTDIEIISLQSRADPKELLGRLGHDVNGVVIDSYLADVGYQCSIRNKVPLLVISDDAQRDVCGDIVVNGNLYAQDLDYDYHGEEPIWCLGPEYLLLRQSIVKHSAKPLKWRATPERALITMGGSDTTNVTPEVLRAFDGYSISVDTIVGPGFTEEQEQEIKRVASTISVRDEVVRNPPNLAERMYRADFAVCTASTTTYELLALGTPIITLPVVNNQRLLAQALEKHDVATVIQTSLSRQTAIARSIGEYIKDDDTRRDRSHKGRNLIDGRGTRRITDVIQSEF